MLSPTMKVLKCEWITDYISHELFYRTNN